MMGINWINRMRWRRALWKIRFDLLQEAAPIKHSNLFNMDTPGNDDLTNKASNTNAGGPMGGSGTSASSHTKAKEVKDGEDGRNDMAEESAKEVEEEGMHVTGHGGKSSANGTEGEQ